MRLLKLLVGLVLAIAALAFGLVVFSLLAIAGLGAYVYLRLRAGRSGGSVVAGRRPGPSRGVPGDVIEVEATEVPARRLES
ncbi:MAG: hypothetical protein RLZZ447_912 [Verrucomicrobiota bacterium]|jgi:hypothetical protein